MKTMLTAAVLFSLVAFADGAKVLTADEQATLCAQALPKQLACKEDFCAAMVGMRFPGKDAKAKAELQAACLAEIAVDGTGTEAERVARCKAWSKTRPAMKVTAAQAADITACWSKPACGDQISCWGAKTAALMK